MGKRLYWQSIRGICILAVVLIHSLGGYDYVDDGGFVLLRQFINFAVATFIFMAGYFVDVNAMKSGSIDCKAWLTMRGGAIADTFCGLVTLL